MDPNAALTAIHTAIVECNKPNTASLIESVDDLINSFEALDEWLCKGGFLPDAWNEAHPVVADPPRKWDYTTHPFQYFIVFGNYTEGQSLAELAGFTTAGEATEAALLWLGKSLSDLLTATKAEALASESEEPMQMTGFTIERYDGEETDSSWGINGGCRRQPSGGK